jgi:hypothetical protein
MTNDSRRNHENANESNCFDRARSFLTNASFAQQGKTDYDRAANFIQYKTYSWEKVQTPDPLWVDRVKAAVDAALAAKGWT